jgi:hypothetical protein
MRLRCLTILAAGLLVAASFSVASAADHTLANDRLSLIVRQQGGILSDLHILPDGPNLLAQPKSAQAVMFGHFLCFDRWGRVSPEAAALGIPFHGEAVRLPWDWTEETPGAVTQEVTLPIVGLTAKRRVNLAPSAGVYAVTFDVTNPGDTRRTYTAVEHVTLGAAWFHDDVHLSTNAVSGLLHYQRQPKQPMLPDEESVFNWPYARLGEATLDLRKTPPPGPRFLVSAVFADQEPWAWLFQIDRTSGDLIGYIWRPADYPWMILYFNRGPAGFLNRSLEFGTTGLHLPRPELETAGNVLGRPQLAELAAGATQRHQFWGFAFKAPAGASGVTGVAVEGGRVVLEFDEGPPVSLPLPE